MNYKVSIIIPVFNVGNYIKDALESIVNQSIGFENLEVIMVDDCSTDNSAKIMDEYAAKYDNFIAIHLPENSGGAGKPRNVGIERVTSDYVMFLDPDDYYVDGACEILHEKIQAEDVDIVSGTFTMDEDSGNKMVPSFAQKGKNEVKLQTIDEGKEFLNGPPSLWSKIFKRSFIKENGIIFRELKAAQDSVFVLDAFFKANGIIFINKPIIHYNGDRNESVTNKRDVDTLNARMHAYYYLYEICKENGKEEFFISSILRGKLVNWMKHFIFSELNHSEKKKTLESSRPLVEKCKEHDLAIPEELVPVFNCIIHEEYDDAISYLMKEKKNQLKETKNMVTPREVQFSQPVSKLEPTGNTGLEMPGNPYNELNAKIDGLDLRFSEAEFQYNRSLVQRIISRFSSLYILFNRKNGGIKNALINVKGYNAIKKYNLFNTAYYLKNNGDIKSSGMDPILHYIYHGSNENRNPSPDFDPEYYLETYEDVGKSNLNPLIHYALYGIKENRKTTTSLRKKAKENEIMGDMDIRVRSKSVIYGWLAKIGDLKPREAIIQIDDWSFEVLCNNFRNHLKVNKINEGEHAFKFTIPFEFTDGKEHQIKLIDKATGELVAQNNVELYQERKYRDFSDFLANSLISPMVCTPFKELDKRSFSIMENIKKYLITKSLEQPPLVSVIVHITNWDMKTWKGTVDSVLGQTYPNLELIILADSENHDELRQLTRKFGDEKVVLLEKQSKHLNERNLGIKVAKGEYIAHLDSDNTWDPAYIEAMMGAFQELPDAEAVYCGQLLYRNNGIGNDKELFAIRYGSLSRPLLANRNYIDLNSLCYKQDIHDRVGNFDEGLDHFSDWDWILRVVESSQVYSVPVLLSNCNNDALNSINYLKNRGEIRSVRKKREERLKKIKDFSSSKEEHHSISVIIPSFEALEDLRECIESLQKLNIEFLEIIVVDNDSSGPVVDYLNELATDAKIKLILNDVNYGFTYAVKQGITISHPNSDILILNNDAIVTPGALEAMQKAAYQIHDCGLVVPQQVLTSDDNITIDAVPYADPQYPFDINASGVYNNIINVPTFHSGRALEVNFAPFFCAYIRRDIYERSVGLDAELGRHYRSDRIFCNYIRHVMKLKVYHIADAIVYHKVQQSTKELRKSKSDFDLMFTKNQWDPELSAKLNYETAPWDI